ncbi:hypothetical protein B0H13DRAFT_1609565 [Mycena leptocephala]|nr:hypothetical protein B0H13DRAFT_1609565 [Mycena leptocephala]
MLGKLGLFGETPPRMIIHVFSSGGSFQLLWLALALESTSPKPAQQTQPLTCLLFDSAPGSVHLADVQHVLTLSLTGLKRLVGLAVASLIYTGAVTISMITGSPSLHNFIREGLNNPKIFPWMESTTPRLYLYSDADKFSLVSDVKAHIEAAKRKGLNVREEYFLGSQHVQHSGAYPEKYWGAVCSIWGDVVRSKL